MGSPFYAQLSLGIDGDEDIKALAARVRPGQPAPNVLLAAVHYLLLRGADHPLRNFYATLGGAGGEGAFAHLRDFVRRHHAELAALVETRVTNTNEVGRSAILHAGFHALGQMERAPLHLIEIGPSAGLNMIWDDYGIRYRRGADIAAEIRPDAPLSLDCDLQGPHNPPFATPPQIASRTGLELHPVRLNEAQERDWLRALVWPDQPQRLARLDAAIALAAARHLDIRSGDALGLLPQLLAQIPPRQVPCVYHTIAIYQFSAAMKAQLAAQLAGAARPLWHLSFEFDGADGFAANLTHHAGGTAITRKLAMAQAHGAWMEWLA